MMKTFARDIMSTQLIKITEGSTLEDAIRLLVNHQLTGLPVVDSNDKFVGILSEFDIIKQIHKKKKLPSEVFREAITFSRKIVHVRESTPLSKIIETLVTSCYRRLPVITRSGCLVGIISRRDIMRVLFYRSKLE